jgi:hypothetical protein
VGVEIGFAVGGADLEIGGGFRWLHPVISPPFDSRYLAYLGISILLVSSFCKREEGD